MKKILSTLLLMILSLFVVGTTDLLQAEATEDVTIYLHIHQFDGEYTNTGTGIWDGQTWNDFADVATTTDGFGAVIAKTYTAAEINAVSDEIEFKPTRDVNNDDNVLEGGLAGNSNYLAPDSVEGKVFADVTMLKDGSETELHLYYVEGAKSFYAVAGAPVNGMFFNVYANPEVAADATIYDGWGMHTWNNGLADIDYFTNPNKYEIEMELESEVGWIPARLGIIEVAPGNVGNAGFIAHFGENAEEEVKSCSSDMSFDTDALLALDGMAQVVYYQHGNCEFTPSYDDFLTDVATLFEINSGNRLVQGTQIVSPNELDVVMLMGKTPEQLLAEYFSITDGDGNEIPILDITYPILTFGSYESDVELRTETHVVVFVDTDLDASNVALVGNIQGWAPDTNPILTTGQDINGYDVFEFTTFETTAEFKFLFDADANGFNWGDQELIGSNIVVDLSAGGTIQVFFDDATDTVTLPNATPQDVDIVNFTYTSGVTCTPGQNLFTLFLDTELDHTKIGLVGSIQEANNWSPENAILPTGETTDGLVVFEVCLDGTNVEYKVLYNENYDGVNTNFAWGDRELVQSNVVVDFGEGTTDGEIAHLINGPITVLGDYVPTLSATSIYRLSIYMSGDVDWSKVAIVGGMNGWDIENPITHKEIDAFGNAIFDIEVNSKTGDYLVVYDADNDGFDWDDKISGNDNITYDLGAASTLVQYAMIFDANVLTFDGSAWSAWYGDQWSGFTTSTSTIMDDALVVDVKWDTAPGASYATQVYQNGFALENGKHYRISFDAKADAAKDVIVAFGDELAADPWFTEFVPKTTFNLGTEWMTYTLDFTMNEATTADQGKLVFELATAVQTKVYLDNIKFEEIDAIDGNVVADTDQVMDGDFEHYATVMSFQDIGATIDELVTTSLTLHVADDTFLADGEYYLSYLEEVLVELVDPSTLATELFISEYIEGSGNNKAIEIYNPTGADVDLTAYSIVENYGSGTNSYALTGTLAAGDVLVICTTDITTGTLLEDNCDIQLAYPSVVHFNGDDTVQLLKDSVVIDQIGVESEAGDGDKYLGEVTLVRSPEVFAGTTTFDMSEWTSYDQNTYDYIGSHVFAPTELVPSYISTEQLPIVLSNNFVGPDPVAESGTYAMTPTTIRVQFENVNVLDVLLKDAQGNVVAFESMENFYQAGTHTPVGTCDAAQTQIFVHIRLRETEVDSASQLGIVGSLNGWDVVNSIQAVGMDSEGNYVFEVCLDEGVTSGEFKIKYDPDSDGFTWDGATDPELTPANVAFDTADGVHFFVLEGQSELDVVDTLVYTLSSANALDKDSEYTLEVTDANGFVLSLPLDMDDDAPVIQSTRIPNTPLVFEFEQESDISEFDLMDYYTILTFVDTRDGDLGYEIVQTLDLTETGNQTVIISATDSWNNTATFNITINVVYIDTIAPTITGDTEVTFTVGDELPDWESYVTISDGTLTINTTQVDMTSPGTFFVIYTVEDEAGNRATHTLEVTIEAAEVIEEVKDTGCFGALNLANTLITVVIVALGGAVLFVARKR